MSFNTNLKETYPDRNDTFNTGKAHICERHTQKGLKKNTGHVTAVSHYVCFICRGANSAKPFSFSILKWY